jgi:multicomponent Na+:H+ antiporter subunit B
LSRSARLAVFGVGAAGLGALLLWGLSGLPDFGHYTGEYGRILARIAVPERQATSVVATVTFDVRALDTLGEELILFVAAFGVAALLRAQREEHEIESAAGAGEEQPPSDAIRSLLGASVAPIVLLGIYLVIHGWLTPGGGFQGGVVIASAGLVFYLSGRRVAADRLDPARGMEQAEGIGAAGFALIGLGGLLFAGTFFENFLPYGTQGSLISGGTIGLSNIAVAIEVTGAFLAIFSELLEQTLLHRSRGSG